MTEVSERYKRLSDAFADKIEGVKQDRWTSPSPCDDWTARDVVGHVIQTQGMFLGFIGREVGDGPSVDDDPRGAWDAARSAVQRDLEDTERAAQEFDGFTGRTRFDDAVNRFLCFDLVVHGWDLAHATGQEEVMQAEDISRVHEQAEAFGDAMRGPQAFGPEVEPPEGADEQAKLLAFLGRRS